LLSEIECYLKILPTGQYFQQGRISPGLVLAIDNDDTVVGCVLYARGDVDNACGLIYAVVSREYRRNGIMRGMITKLRETITNIGLSCTIETVPIYEKLGFAVRDAKGPQIAMDTGGPTRPMGLYDTPFYSQNRRVREAESQLKNALGKRFEVLLHNLDHDARCGAEKARNFVAKYKA
jgi:GNAT superfamily N-acetyltransferase